jgi:hypothetical protein
MTESAIIAPIATINPTKPAKATGLLHGALDGQDEDGDNDDTEAKGRPGTDLKTNSETNEGMLMKHIVVHMAKHERKTQKKEEEEEDQQEEDPCFSADDPSSCRTGRNIHEQIIP